MTTGQRQTIRSCGQILGRVVYEENGIRFDLQRPTMGLRTLVFPLTLFNSTDLARVLKLDEQLAMRLHSDAVRIARHRGFVLVEIQLPQHLWRSLALSQMRPGRGLASSLGINTLNKPVRVDLGDPSTAHALVAGTTGSGKTTLIKSMISQACLADPANLRLLLIDPKGELGAFSNVAHLAHRRIDDVGEAVQALGWAAAEIDRRKDGRRPYDLIIIIDELAALVAQAGESVAGSLALIASLGRARGVHLVGGTQYVSNKTLGGPMAKVNFGLRLVGVVPDASASALATGQKGMGADKLSGKGDFLAVAPNIDERLIVARVDRDQVERLPRTETPPVLPLAEIDPQTAVAVAHNGRQCTGPGEYGEVLAWIAHNERQPGIGKIKSMLGIGSGRAKRVQSEAWQLLEALEVHGATVAIMEDSNAQG